MRLLTAYLQKVWKHKEYRMDLNFCGTKLSRFLRFDSHVRRFSPCEHLDQRLLGNESSI